MHEFHPAYPDRLISARDVRLEKKVIAEIRLEIFHLVLRRGVIFFSATWPVQALL